MLARLLGRTKAVPAAEPQMSLREQLRRANPSVSGPTYDVLKGNITDVEYRRQMRQMDRKRG